MALDAATIIPFVEMRALSVSVHYNQVDALTRLVSQLKGKVLDKKFDQNVQVKVSLPMTEVAAFTHKYTQTI
jgi:putative IMPACT (imprinted ancient) family translation regulator